MDGVEVGARSKHEGGYNRATSNVQPGAWRRRTRSEHHKYRPTEISLSGSGLPDNYVINSSCPKCGPLGFEPKDYQVTALIMGTSRSCLRWASELASSSTTTSTTTTTKVCNKYSASPSRRFRIHFPEYVFVAMAYIPVSPSVLPIGLTNTDRKSTRLNSSHSGESRMPSSA